MLSLHSKTRIGRRLLKTFVAVLVLIVGLAVAGLTWLFSIGPYRLVEIETETPPIASPAVLGAFEGEPAVSDEAAWRQRRERLLRAFETNVYGPLPTGGEARIIQRIAIPAVQAGGIEGVEQWEIALEGVGQVNLVLVTPPGPGPFATIILQQYCGNRAAFPGRPAAIAAPLHYYPPECRSGIFDPAHRTLMGQWILGPPFDLITRRGYAVAIFYGGDVIPDHAAEAKAALAQLGYPDTGAIAAWAWSWSRVLDVLRTDPRLDPEHMIAWGESRFGKTALLAGAIDERFFGVVALQSGRGGDALTAHREGESIANIMKSFPYWFSARFADYAKRDPPIDQHHLLALIAPRPLLLGYARRDAWSDPVGGIAALRGAEPVFDLLAAPRPRFFVRDGRHGVTMSDWEATLDFLDEVIAQ